MNIQQIKSASDVKYHLNPDSHFFDRASMKWFGDTMSSFGVRNVTVTSDNRDPKPDDVAALAKWSPFVVRDIRVMYRKPSAMVNVFGKRELANRDYFGAWEIVDSGDHVDLRMMEDGEKSCVYMAVV